VSSDEAFNLPAAALRAERGELETSVDVLAGTLEQALPGLASVERRKVGGFRSKRREVRRIVVALGDERLELLRTEHGLQWTLQKVVRGITLSRRELSAADWLGELIAAVARSGELHERDRVALEGLLR
jgi:hypothetical protein